MTRKCRRQHGPQFKAQVAIVALAADKPLAQLAREFDLHPNVVRQWKDQLMEYAVAAFAPPDPHQDGPDAQVLQAQIDALKRENDFLEHALASTGWLGA